MLSGGGFESRPRLEIGLEPTAGDHGDVPPRWWAQHVDTRRATCNERPWRCAGQFQLREAAQVSPHNNRLITGGL